MHRRAGFVSIGLLAALLALVVTALTPVAWRRRRRPSPAAGGRGAAGDADRPGVIPDPTARARPSGPATRSTSTSISTAPSSTPAACELLTVDGEEISRSPSRRASIELSPGTRRCRCKWDEPTFAKGDFTFDVTLFDTTAAAPVYDEKTGKTSTVRVGLRVRGRAAGGSLINFEVMKDWFWYIAARRHRHRRADGHLHPLRLHPRPLRLPRPALQEDDLQAGVGPLPEPRATCVGWSSAASPTGSRPSTPRCSAARRCCCRSSSSTRAIPEIIKAFGLPDTYNPPAFWSGVAALSLNYGAYLTEVFRAGIQAVPKGQNEAAWAIGLSGWQTQRRIILPQAFKIVIPAVGNDFIALIKDTSLVSVITVEELLRRSQLAGAATLQLLQHPARGGRLVLGADDLLQLLAGQARDAHGARQGPREGEGEGEVAWGHRHTHTRRSPTTRAASSSSRSRACRSTSAGTTCSRASTSRSTRARCSCSSGRPAPARARSCAA